MTEAILRENYMASSSNISARSQSSSLAAAAPVVLLGRLLFAMIFVMSGPMHFSSQTIAYAASQGIPLASIAVPLSGVLALAGGLSIVLGFSFRRAAHELGVLIAVVALGFLWQVFME